MGTFNNSKHRHAICLKFGDLYFTSLSDCPKEKPETVLQSKKIYFYIALSFGYLLSLSWFDIFLIAMSVSQRSDACNSNH